MKRFRKEPLFVCDALSDNKMTKEQQERIIKAVKACVLNKECKTLVKL